jgi:hypothetical protein
LKTPQLPVSKWPLKLPLAQAPLLVTVIVTALLLPLTQPETVQVAVYEVVAVGDTVTLFPEAPFDQETVPPQPEAESVAL